MLPPLTVNDFQGKFRLSRDTFEVSQLESYINRYYKQYLIQLVGIDTVKDVESLRTLTDKYNAMFFGTSYKSICYTRSLYFRGLLDIIKGHIYFEFVRDYALHSNTGFVENKNENAFSSTAQMINARGINYFNEGVEHFNFIGDDFLCQYMSVKEPITGATYSGVSGRWTITQDCNIYLEDGDKVVIDNIEYEAVNVIRNTSFEIVAADTLVILEQSFTYYPFELVELCYQQAITL